MAFKQPRVPEYRESDGTGKYIRSLVLFLKDFCMDVWTANKQRSGEIDAVRESVPEVDYPVTSVCGKTGDVTLTAGDVGALAADGTAENAGKLGGKTAAELMLTLYPVGAVYISANSTSPASLFGGEWTQINGRFLIGTGAPELNDDGTSPGSYNFAAGSKGGEAEHTLIKLEMPTHYHNAYCLGLGGSSTAPAYYATLNRDSYTYNYQNTTPNTETVAATISEGSGAAHNNMPPYLAVYMWKRVR